MIGKLARRLGFQQSVAVSLIDGWSIPTVTKAPIELAPRGGAASCRVDQFGRIQVRDATWTLDLTLAGGARWVAVAEADRVSQKLLAPGVVQTTIQTPSGPVLHRVSAGVVGGEPVAIIEVENTGGVAIAIGLAVRPFQIDGRGYIGEVEIDQTTISIEGESAVRFGASPASVAATDGPTGDVLQHLPEANDGVGQAAAKCRSGGAQAAAVWPLPHTATLRFVVELGEATSPDASVPTTDDINRGWVAHLKHGMRVEVDELDIDEQMSTASRSALTLWPETQDSPLAILALAEMGFGRDAGRFFDLLEDSDDDDRIVRSLARWAQLGEQAHQLEDLERILGRLAQAAHGVASRGGEIAGHAWLDAALVALGGRLHQIGQPDVAERVQGFSVVHQAAENLGDQLGLLTKARDKRGIWPDGQMHSAAAYLRTIRSIVIDDTGTEMRLLPEVPLAWRGRTIDVFGVPVANGHVSFGLRWHGPRPALLWEANLAPEVAVAISVPGIDPDFSSTERQGEALLADPGWDVGKRS